MFWPLLAIFSFCNIKKESIKVVKTVEGVLIKRSAFVDSSLIL